MTTTGIRYAEGLKILPVLAPANIVATATSTGYVDLDGAHWATFLIQFGAMTSDTTDTVTITVECSTAATSNATEQTIAFDYRLSAAVLTDTMGAITAATSDGAAIVHAEDDNKLVVIDIDPSAVAAKAADMRWVRVTLTPNAEMAACTVGAIAVLEPRFPGNAIPSST